MRTLGGILLGILLFFPGIILLQWLAVQVLGIYDAMTLTDGCLVMIIILLSVYVMRQPRAARAARPRRSSSETDVAYEEPYLEHLRGSSTRKRRTASATAGTGKRTQKSRSKR